MGQSAPPSGSADFWQEIDPVTFKYYDGGHYSFPVEDIVQYLDEHIKAR